MTDIIRTAAKNHNCSCGNEIKKGEKYLSATYFCRDEDKPELSPFHTDKFCMKCVESFELESARFRLVVTLVKILCTKQPHVFEDFYENGGWMDQGDYTGTFCVNCGVNKYA